METIPVFKPLLEAEEIGAAREALEMGWLGMGSYVRSFEEDLARLCETGDRRVAAVSTGHAALHLSLMLIGAGPGDEVITPSFNNITDFQAILATGASPVLCDIDDRTLCLDVAQVKDLITPKTKAVIATDYACMLADHEGLADLANRHDVRIVHDAAHSIGSRWQGKAIGSFSDIAIFSFDPVKTFTCIDGGAMVVPTAEDHARVCEMRLVGMGQPSETLYRNERAWTYDVRGLGFRYHMANLHAAIGRAQVRKIDRIAATRRDTCRFYNRAFADLAGAEVITPRTGYDDVVPFLYYIRVPAERRDALRTHLRERGVDTGIHWQPGHWFTLLKEARRGDLTVTERVGREILSLPLHSCMPEAWRDRVVDAVTSFFRPAPR